MMKDGYLQLQYMSLEKQTEFQDLFRKIKRQLTNHAPQFERIDQENSLSSSTFLLLPITPSQRIRLHSVKIR